MTSLPSCHEVSFKNICRCLFFVVVVVFYSNLQMTRFSHEVWIANGFESLAISATKAHLKKVIIIQIFFWLISLFFRLFN